MAIPDKKNAASLLNASRKDMEFTLSLDMGKNSASTIVRNVYECFRMLGEAILIFKGWNRITHDTSINALIELKVQTARPVKLIDNLSQIRHGINYDGYMPSIEEAQDAISLAKACFNPLAKEVERLIKK